MYFLLGVSARHQGGVGVTGGGCPFDTRVVSARHPVRARTEIWPIARFASRRHGRHHRGNDRHPFRVHPAPAASASNPSPGRTPVGPLSLHRKGLRILNARPPVLFLTT